MADPITLDNLPYEPDHLFENPLVELTQSAMSEFVTCQQKYVFRYLMKIVPGGVSVPLVVGTAVHSAFEWLLDPKNDKKSLRERINKVRDLVDGTFDRVVERSDMMWSLNNDKLEHGRAQAHAVVEAWQVTYDHKTMFKVLHTELNIRAKEGATIKSPLLERGAGKIDGVVIDLISNQVMLLEHKTRYTLKDLDFVEGLALDHQALWYWLLYEKWFDNKANKKLVKAKTLPTGFYYDAIAKPMHRSGDTFEELKDRMVKAMCEKPDQYFSLTPVTLEADAIRRAEKNFGKIAKRMDGLNPCNVEMNTRACNMYGGCAYRKLCNAGAEASDPKKVLSLPQLEMYRFRGEHEELALVEEEE